MIGEMSDRETTAVVPPGKLVSRQPVRPDDAPIISAFQREACFNGKGYSGLVVYGLLEKDLKLP